MFGLMRVKTHNWVIGGYKKKIAKLENENAMLRADLYNAQRNDSPKDPKTGRFVKK